jgi:hypothetical protein
VAGFKLPRAHLIRETQPYSKKIAHRGRVEPSLLAQIEYRAKSAPGEVRHPRGLNPVMYRCCHRRGIYGRRSHGNNHRGPYRPYLTLGRFGRYFQICS